MAPRTRSRATRRARRAVSVQDYKVVQTAGGYGMEAPGLTWIPTGVGRANLSYLVAHETAHQWFYGIVGNDQAREPFTDEAVTDFLARYVPGPSAVEPLLAGPARPVDLQVLVGLLLRGRLHPGRQLPRLRAKADGLHRVLGGHARLRVGEPVRAELDQGAPRHARRRHARTSARSSPRGSRGSTEAGVPDRRHGARARRRSLTQRRSPRIVDWLGDLVGRRIESSRGRRPHGRPLDSNEVWRRPVDPRDRRRRSTRCASPVRCGPLSRDDDVVGAREELEILEDQRRLGRSAQHVLDVQHEVTGPSFVILPVGREVDVDHVADARRARPLQRAHGTMARRPSQSASADGAVRLGEARAERHGGENGREPVRPGP